jgi:hypothetical protein
LGAAKILPVYWDLDEVLHKHKLVEPKFLGVLALTAIIVSGTVYFALKQADVYGTIFLDDGTGKS